MAGYVAVNRLSLLQLYEEERKQRAHLKKIAELQRRSRIDNRKPVHFPHIAHNFSDHAKEKNKEIIKENNAQSKRILNIMKSKSTQPPPPPPFRPTTNPNRRFQSLQLSQNNQEYLERIAKTKGIYDVREWQRGFEEHKEHLKISKDNKLFTPRDIGINRQRVKAASLIISRRTTPTSSIISMGGHQLNNTH
jgi:hypothetical protein